MFAVQENCTNRRIVFLPKTWHNEVNVHCEQVLRMKRVVSPLTSNMTQKRKEMLVFLQAEHKLLRALSKKDNFKERIVNRLG